jgi:hypothetical protein
MIDIVTLSVVSILINGCSKIQTSLKIKNVKKGAEKDIDKIIKRTKEIEEEAYKIKDELIKTEKEINTEFSKWLQMQENVFHEPKIISKMIIKKLEGALQIEMECEKLENNFRENIKKKKFTENKQIFKTKKGTEYKFIGLLNENNKPNGIGKAIYFKMGEGCKYIGEFKNGVRVGKGVFTNEWQKDGGKVNITYKGEWKDDKANGTGIKKITGGPLKLNYSWSEGGKEEEIEELINFSSFVQDKSLEITLSEYYGDWVDSKRQGLGMYVTSQTPGELFTSSGRNYYGNFKNNKKDGYGNYIFFPYGKNKYGEFYSGEWKNGKMNGKGYFNRWGHKNVGYWVKGIFNKGIIKNRDGSFERLGYIEYIGELSSKSNGRVPMVNGKGIIYLSNGEVYVGEFKDDEINGNGKYTFANGEVYVGEFKDDEINGNGKYTFANGNGKYTFANGDVYEGKWENGKKHGNGKYTSANGVVYVGEFKYDKINGKGKYTSANVGVYDGEWENGKKHGNGTFTFANGEVYVGEFKDDEINGNGIYTFANGDVYVGEFKDGKINGKGTMKFTDGDVYDGEWRNNKPYSEKDK